MIKKISVLFSVIMFNSNFATTISLPGRSITFNAVQQFITTKCPNANRWSLLQELDDTKNGNWQALENLGNYVYRNYIDYGKGQIFLDNKDGYLAAFILGIYILGNLVDSHKELYPLALLFIHKGLCDTPKERLIPYFSDASNDPLNDFSDYDDTSLSDFSDDGNAHFISFTEKVSKAIAELPE